MRRVNINLSSVEYDRAAGDFEERVWPVVSQLVNAEAGTTPVCPGCPLALSSRCSDPGALLLSALSSAVIRVLSLPSLYSVFSLPYAYVIHRLGGQDLHADVDPGVGPVCSLRITLRSCERGSSFPRARVLSIQCILGPVKL